MTPRQSLVSRLRCAPRRRSRAIPLLLVALALVAPSAAAKAQAGAEPAAPDTLSTSAGSASVPLTTSGAAPLAARSRLDGAFRADRISHASLGAALGVGIGLSSREPWAGAGAVVALAVAKELLDDTFDRGDLAAGAAGAGLAWLIVAALTR